MSLVGFVSYRRFVCCSLGGGCCSRTFLVLGFVKSFMSLFGGCFGLVIAGVCLRV